MANEKHPIVDPVSLLKKLVSMIPLLNTLILLAALGFIVYSKLLFKRPQITESTERQRITETLSSPLPFALPGLVNFKSVSINIASYPRLASLGEAETQTENKLHYLTLTFSLEIRDTSKADLIEEARPFIMDKLLLLLGKKYFHELVHVQGRYILHSQMIDLVNQIVNSLAKKPLKEGLVTNIYFTQFIVQ